jgi:glyoxylase-like metal-dependent hydrolase (beta-lactamase superfamily II)
VEDETIDLGGMTLVILHTPGHSPGHLAFYIPEHQLLFSADVDLTPFGPFYGHDFADIDDFIQSIDKLIGLKARIVTSGHAGPFEGNVSRFLDEYKKIIHRRERQLIECLNQPRSLDYFSGRSLIFKSYPEPAELIQWFERVHIEKHLERLVSSGKVRQQADMWVRT